MDALERLAEKNRQHQKYKTAENIAALILLIGLLPFYSDMAYSALVLGHEFPQGAVYLAISLFGSLSFALPIMAMGDLLLFPRALKVVMFVVLQAWFAYFWVLSEESWVAFMPLVPVFLILQFQIPKIKELAEKEDGI